MSFADDILGKLFPKREPGNAVPDKREALKRSEEYLVSYGKSLEATAALLSLIHI